MATIYELTEEQQRLLDVLYFVEDDEEALQALEKINLTLERKINFLADIVAELDDKQANEKALRDAAYARLDANYKKTCRNYERTKDYLLQSMQLTKTEKAEGKIGKYTLCKRKEMNIEQVMLSELPGNLFREFPKLRDLLKVSEAKKYIKEHFDEYADQVSVEESYYLRG